jgi:two-component system NtrC family sensor kinase
VTTERILIMDSNSETRGALEGVLSSRGYTVLTAANGAEGLRRAIHDAPDLVLIDAELPDLAGLDVVETWRREGYDLPFILAADAGASDQAGRAMQLGARAYVPKPCSPTMILEWVERALHEMRLRQERDMLAEQLTQANQRLQWQLQELNALFAVGHSVTSVQDLEQVLARIVEVATYMARAEEGSLMLLDADTGELVLRAARNVDEQVAQGLRVPVTDSLAGRVVHTGRPVLLSGEGLKKVATAYLVKSLLMVPLRVPGRGVGGVLMVANRAHGRVFSEADLHLLSALADYAAVAIDNAELLVNLRTEKQKLEAILRETQDAVLVIDDQNQVLLCNLAARLALGLENVEVIGQPVQAVVRNQDLLDLGQIHCPAMTEVALSDGRILNAHFSPVEGIGAVIVMQDITHLKELDRIKSEFVSTVSHDLRTPLTTIQGYIDLLPRAGPLTEQQEVFIARVQRSLSAITQLVSDLLDMGRVEAGFDLEMGVIELGPVVREAVAELRPAADAKAQSLHIQMPEDLSPIRGNLRRLRQVMSNLVSNAVKYTPHGGHITVNVTEGENHLSIRVIDDGIGIPLADQPYVFDKFFRVDAPETYDIPGTGLGLSIVKSVIEKHGGRVWVESAPGEGSTFTVLLPK